MVADSQINLWQQIFRKVKSNILFSLIWALPSLAPTCSFLVHRFFKENLWLFLTNARCFGGRWNYELICFIILFIFIFFRGVGHGLLRRMLGLQWDYCTIFSNEFFPSNYWLYFLNIQQLDYFQSSDYGPDWKVKSFHYGAKTLSQLLIARSILIVIRLIYRSTCLPVHLAKYSHLLLVSWETAQSCSQ